MTRRPPDTLPTAKPAEDSRVYLSISEVCEMCGLSRSTLYVKMNAGIIPFSDKLGRRRIPRASLEALFN